MIRINVFLTKNLKISEYVFKNDQTVISEAVLQMFSWKFYGIFGTVILRTPLDSCFCNNLLRNNNLAEFLRCVSFNYREIFAKTNLCFNLSCKFTPHKVIPNLLYISTFSILKISYDLAKTVSLIYSTTRMTASNCLLIMDELWLGN